jgi:hypothetical protein
MKKKKTNLILMNTFRLMDSERECMQLPIEALISCTSFGISNAWILVPLMKNA